MKKKAGKTKCSDFDHLLLLLHRPSAKEIWGKKKNYFYSIFEGNIVAFTGVRLDLAREHESRLPRHVVGADVRVPVRVALLGAQGVLHNAKKKGVFLKKCSFEFVCSKQNGVVMVPWLHIDTFYIFHEKCNKT